MSYIEDLQNLKDLLDQGAITNEEFKVFKEGILNKQLNNKGEKTQIDDLGEFLAAAEISQSEYEKLIDEDLTISFILNERIINRSLRKKIASAGQSIKSFVNYTVFTNIFMILAVFLLINSYIKILITWISRQRVPTFDDVFSDFLPAILFGNLALFCWIMSLVKMFKAGKIMDESQLLSFSNVWLKNIKPKPQKKDILCENCGAKVLDNQSDFCKECGLAISPYH